MERVVVINIMADGSVRKSLSGYLSEESTPDLPKKLISDFVLDGAKEGTK